MITIENVPIPQRKTPAEALQERVEAINNALAVMKVGQSLFVPDLWGVPAHSIRPPDEVITRAVRMREDDAGAVFEGGAFIPGVRHYRLAE